VVERYADGALWYQSRADRASRYGKLDELEWAVYNRNANQPITLTGTPINLR